MLLFIILAWALLLIQQGRPHTAVTLFLEDKFQRGPQCSPYFYTAAAQSYPPPFPLPSIHRPPTSSPLIVQRCERLIPNSPMYFPSCLMHHLSIISSIIFLNIPSNSPFLVLNMYCANLIFIFISLPLTVDAPISPCSSATYVYPSGGASSICLQDLYLHPLNKFPEFISSEASCIVRSLSTQIVVYVTCFACMVIGISPQNGIRASEHKLFGVRTSLHCQFVTLCKLKLLYSSLHFNYNLLRKFHGFQPGKRYIKYKIMYEKII